MWSGSRVPDARPDGWSEEDHFCTAWCLGSKARQHLSNVTLLFNRPLNLINLVPWLKQNFGDVIINFFGSAEFTGQYSMSKTIIIKELSCFPFRRVTHVNAAHGKLLGFSAVFFPQKAQPIGACKLQLVHIKMTFLQELHVVRYQRIGSSTMHAITYCINKHKYYVNYLSTFAAIQKNRNFKMAYYIKTCLIS